LKSRVSKIAFPPFWGIFEMTTSKIGTTATVSSHDCCQKLTPVGLHLYRVYQKKVDNFETALNFRNPFMS
jgi:hypothetical protein